MMKVVSHKILFHEKLRHFGYNIRILLLVLNEKRIYSECKKYQVI